VAPTAAGGVVATRALQVNITGDASSFNRAIRSIDDDVKRSEGRLKGFAATGAKALGGLGLAAGAGAAVGLKQAAQAAIDAEASMAKVAKMVDNAGFSWDKHREKIDRVIQAQSRLSGLDDEELAESFGNMVRTTGNLNEAFKLNALAADIARTKGMQLAGAQSLIARVYNDSFTGVKRLGIAVEEGATKQEVLADLQAKFAGQAKAYGETTAGSVDRASVAWENLLEVLGARLLPIITKVATGFLNLVDKTGELSGPIKQVSGVVRNAYDAIAGAVTGFARRNRREIDTAIEAFQNLGKAARYVFQEVILPVVRASIRAIVPILEGLRDTLSGLVRFVTNILTGQWGKAWDAAVDTVKGAFKTVKSVVTGAADILFTAVKAVGGQIIKGIVAGLKGLANAVKNAVVNGVKGGLNAAKDAVSGAASDVGNFLLGPLGDGVGKAVSNAGLSMGAPGLGGGSLMGADPDLAPFAAIGSRFGLQTTSGIRPGSITSSGNTSYHSSGDAIDMSGPAGAMLRTFQYLKKNVGGRLRELIYTPGGAGIKDGRPYRYTGQVASDHYDHVHVAYTGPFGDGIGDAAKAASRYWKGQDLVNAVAVAGPESSYRDAARLVSSVEDSRGMWQVNTYAHPWARAMNLRDTNQAAAAAYRVWKGAGGSWSPWTGYTSGGYRGFLSRARAAVAALRNGGGSSGAGGGGGGAANKIKVGTVTPLGMSTGMGTVTQAGAGLGTGMGGTLADLPAMTDILDAQAAEAALTPGTADDVAAADAAVSYWDQQLGIARQQGNYARIAESARNLKSARDNRSSLEAALDRNTEALLELEKTQRVNAERALAVSQSQYGVLARAIADVSNGFIGGAAGLGFETPSFAGGLARA
jgi:hypothetical protein